MPAQSKNRRTAVYVGYSEASVYTGMSVRSLARRVASGALPAWKIGRETLFDRADLDDLKRPVRRNGAK